MTYLAQFQLFMFRFFRQKQCDYAHVYSLDTKICKRGQYGRDVMIDKTCLCKMACFLEECF